VARVTEGDLSARGLAALSSRMDRAQLALAIRFDPNDRHAALLGLTPGWESLTLAGKPSLELGTNGLQAQRLNAAMPADRGALREARPFVFNAASEADRQRALRCLTQGGEDDGVVAVAFAGHTLVATRGFFPARCLGCKLVCLTSVVLPPPLAGAHGQPGHRWLPRHQRCGCHPQ
jgi:hypothetical protein